MVNPQKRANIIIWKWYFQLKKDQFGHILKYKTCWVSHGYKQEESFDYVETFAVVVKLISYKCLFAVGVKYGYQIRYMDMVTTFLYDFLDKFIYIEKPHLFANKQDKVCKLMKTFY